MNARVFSVALLVASVTTCASRRGDPPPTLDHTRHLRPDGSPQYTNRLIFETSPYLLQHAHNPVNWYPWGDEAFETAKRLQRPVLLSVGYSTCHWCHVMEDYVCEQKVCALPTSDPHVLARQLATVPPLATL